MGKWLIQIQDAVIDRGNIFKADKSYNAVIATALNTIKFPRKDYSALKSHLISKYPDISHNGTHLISSKSCKHINLDDFVIKIEELYYNIP